MYTVHTQAYSLGPLLGGRNEVPDFHLLPFGGSDTTTPTVIHSITPISKKVVAVTNKIWQQHFILSVSR